MEATGCEIIGDAPATLRVNGQTDRYTFPKVVCMSEGKGIIYCIG